MSATGMVGKVRPAQDTRETRRLPLVWHVVYKCLVKERRNYRVTMHRSRRGRRAKIAWGKWIAIVCGALAALLVIAYFVVTSSGFIKAVILPKAGQALNARVTAESVSLSPFSSVSVAGLRVETTGPEPLLTAKSARVRYSLIDILRGNINVNEIAIASPVVQIVENPDGTSNLDPILNRQKSEDPSSDSDEPVRLSLRDVSLKDGIVRQIQKNADGTQQTTELAGLNIALDRLGNGQSGKLTLNAGLTLAQTGGATNDTLRGTINGGYDIALSDDLLPTTITGSTKLAVTSAQGGYADLTGFGGALDADLTPTELRRVALLFTKNDQRLGEIRASGPFDLERGTGNVRLEILSLDKNALALLAAAQGIDFRESAINSTNQITISQEATFFAASGTLSGTEISISRGQTTTPEMNLHASYEATLNTAEKSAVLQKLEISGSAEGRQFLRTELDRQMNLSWGEAVKGFRDASLNIVLTNFNLGQWGPVFGTNITAGMLQANVSLAAQQDGKVLKTDLSVGVNGLGAVSGTNRVQNLDAALDLRGTLEKLNILNVDRYSFSLRQGGAEVLQGTGAAHYEMDNKNTKAQLSARGSLPQVLALVPVSGLTAREGRLELSANYSETGGQQRAVGSVTVASFTGAYDPYQFEKFQAVFEYQLEMDPRKIEIPSLALTFSQEFHAGGSIDLAGRYNRQDQTGQFTFRTVDLNQNTFRPFLAPSLGENQLVSISLNSAGEAVLNSQGENAIKGSFKIGNWVVKDPAGKLPSKPLAAELTVDAGMREETLALRSVALKLSPTERAKNELRIEGKIDLGATNPAPSNLAIRSDSLDLTPYYDMFAAPTNAAAKTDPPAAETEPPREPEPMQLPLEQFAADLKIDQLFVREMAISNWTGQLTIRSNVLDLRPFKFDLNGGPVELNATVDTGVTGYRYDLAFKAHGVPLEPLVNTFSTGRSNRLDGFLVADTRLTGAGTTGTNLRQNLGGHFSLNLTNLNYELVGPKLRRIVVPISLALGVPELTQTPINWTFARAEIGKGMVDLKQLAVQSEAFYAESSGAITLANVITNSSLNLPLQISLRRSLAEKTRLIPSDTPTNAKYAKLPQFVSVKGTLGAPEADINKLVLAGILARGTAGLGVNLGSEKAGQVLEKVGDLLTGQPGGAATNNAPAETATNSSPVGGLLRGLGGLLGGDSGRTNATNSSGTNAPARRNPLDLLRVLPQKQNNN